MPSFVSRSDRASEIYFEEDRTLTNQVYCQLLILTSRQLTNQHHVIWNHLVSHIFHARCKVILVDICGNLEVNLQYNSYLALWGHYGSGDSGSASP